MALLQNKCDEINMYIKLLEIEKENNNLYKKKLLVLLDEMKNMVKSNEVVNHSELCCITPKLQIYTSMKIVDEDYDKQSSDIFYMLHDNYNMQVSIEKSSIDLTKLNTKTLKNLFIKVETFWNSKNWQLKNFNKYHLACELEILGFLVCNIIVYNLGKPIKKKNHFLMYLNYPYCINSTFQSVIKEYVHDWVSCNALDKFDENECRKCYPKWHCDKVFSSLK